MVMFFKSGDQSDPDRHRPINLLSALYKVYASLWHGRVSHALDPLTSPLQFGFRRGKSTSDPIHIPRGIMELFEESGSALYMLFLD